MARGQVAHKGRRTRSALSSIGKELDFDPKVEAWSARLLFQTSGLDLDELARCCKLSTGQLRQVLEAREEESLETKQAEQTNAVRYNSHVQHTRGEENSDTQWADERYGGDVTAESLDNLFDDSEDDEEETGLLEIEDDEEGEGGQDERIAVDIVAGQAAGQKAAPATSPKAEKAEKAEKADTAKPTKCAGSWMKPSADAPDPSIPVVHTGKGCDGMLGVCPECGGTYALVGAYMIPTHKI